MSPTYVFLKSLSLEVLGGCMLISSLLFLPSSTKTLRIIICNKSFCFECTGFFSKRLHKVGPLLLTWKRTSAHTQSSQESSYMDFPQYLEHDNTITREKERFCFQIKYIITELEVGAIPKPGKTRPYSLTQLLMRGVSKHILNLDKGLA